MDILELKADQTKKWKFQYLFSYIIAKKISFLSDSLQDLSVSYVMSKSPSLLIESITNRGVIIKDSYHLTNFFTPYSINSIIDLKTNDIVIPEMNFRNAIDASDYVRESKITFKCLDENMKLFISIEETPGVEAI